VDGPPGIGCPVIASITGASYVLVVTEPTLAGEHDLRRVAALAQHFQVPTAVCVNKWDINPEVAERIEQKAAEGGVSVFARIPYDSRVTRAQVEGQAVVERGGAAADAIRQVWEELCKSIRQ